MTKTRFLALITALALLLAIPTSVFAQNAKPHVFVGTATLDGATAADGAAVTAWVGGEQVASTTVKGGQYDILVGDSVGYAGETVSFKLSGADASETAAWVEGGGDIVNLTAASGSSGGGAGAEGEKGATGTRGLKGVAGPAGPAGADGAAGAAGPAGATGSAGSDGSDGSDGAAGSSGSTGAAGPAGATGAAGADGGGGVIGIIALIVAAVALLAAGGSYMMGRRA